MNLDPTYLHTLSKDELIHLLLTSISSKAIEEFTISVKNIETGQSNIFKFSSNDTINDIKRKACVEWGLGIDWIDQMRIIFGGRHLDGKLTLKKAGLRDNVTVYGISRLMGD